MFNVQAHVELEMWNGAKARFLLSFIPLWLAIMFISVQQKSKFLYKLANEQIKRDQQPIILAKQYGIFGPSKYNSVKQTTLVAKVNFQINNNYGRNNLICVCSIHTHRSVIIEHICWWNFREKYYYSLDFCKLFKL